MNLPDGYFLQRKKYQLTHAIGQGGFGITYLGVWNTEVKGELGTMKTKVPVCIKEYFFKDYCYRDKDSHAVKVHSITGEKLFGKFKEKLIEEANILSAVHHPYIVNVLEVFEENNTAYIVMEYIKGCSLKYMLDKEGVLSENKVLKYIHQIGNALDFVHNKTVVHLDIKPGNILIDREDNARLIDFGVSKRYDIEEQETSTTTLTLSKGFASIEQYDDEGMQNFSPRPDIYSLGATMYNLLTGVVPVESILRATKQMLPPSSYNSNITPKTEKAILKAMEIKPEDRFQTVKSMLAAIDVPPYELTENKLIESDRIVEDDHTEVLGAHLSNYPDDDNEQTVVVSSVTSKSLVNSKPGNKVKRRVLLSLVILLSAFIGYAVYSYFFDITSSRGALAGLDMPGDSLIRKMNLTVVSQPDSVRDTQPDQSGTETPQQSGQDNPGQSQANNTRSQTTPGETRIANAQPEVVTLPGNTDNVVNTPTFTSEELALFEKEYNSLISSAKTKMDNRQRNYSGAMDDLTKAFDIVEKTKIKTSYEVESLIGSCKNKMEEQKRKERLEDYETYYPIGDFVVARNKTTGLFGAIDSNGVERIPCKYKTVDQHADGRAFLREDGKSDIYNNKGEFNGTVRLN
ncbi:MAG: serine/threonine protein kinase [Tannerella sp.]|jgi:serine/threonine-protein kinase|nr:serine/threonine protein kinase [Tannerella sp.]